MTAEKTTIAELNWAEAVEVPSNIFHLEKEPVRNYSPTHSLGRYSKVVRSSGAEGAHVPRFSGLL